MASLSFPDFLSRGFKLWTADRERIGSFEELVSVAETNESYILMPPPVWPTTRSKKTGANRSSSKSGAGESDNESGADHFIGKSSADYASRKTGAGESHSKSGTGDSNDSKSGATLITASQVLVSPTARQVRITAVTPFFAALVSTCQGENEI